MAVKLPNGSVVSIAAAYDAADTVSAVSNANPAVCTLSSGHGLVAGDFVEIVSGWSRLNGKVARVGTVTSTSAELEGINTSSTTFYPTGGGGGSLRKITSWTQINQILAFDTSGGEQQFVTYSFLEEDAEHQIPTTRSASSLSLSLADDPSLPWFAILTAANDDRAQRALRLTLPNGSVIAYNAYVTLNQTPTMTKDQVMAIGSTYSLLAPPTRYVS